jgi:hypothetical protein
MPGFRGPASPAIGDALNAGYGILRLSAWAAAPITRSRSTSPAHELERYMRCKDCSAARRYAFKRSQWIALRPNKITADGPASDVAGDRDR